MSNYKYLQQCLRSLNDDPTKPWHQYPCFLWDRGKFNQGYGRVRAGGKDQLVHRVAYQMAHGGIPEGLDILHHCDVQLCFRPIHLFAGTHIENMHDMILKGRANHTLAPRGEHHGLAKLTDAQVIEIRFRYQQGHLQRHIAEDFGIGPAYVSSIVNGKRWRHLLGGI